MFSRTKNEIKTNKLMMLLGKLYNKYNDMIKNDCYLLLRSVCVWVRVCVTDYLSVVAPGPGYTAAV